MSDQYDGPAMAQTIIRLRDELRRGKAERDALLADVERLKNVCLDLAGELMVLQATKQMTAAIDALKEKT